jgi:hypothetical protein
MAAQARVMAAHTSQQRAIEFEAEVELASRRERISNTNVEALR